jgi:hypothetical protein
MATTTKPMTDMDMLIVNRLVPFRRQIIETIKGKHPHIVSMLEAVLSEKRSQVGFRVLEDGKVAGIYTFHLDGIHIVDTEAGKLYAEVHHPMLGVIKPYVEIERKALEKMVADEEFTREPFAAAAKYLPGITIKFLD